MARGPVLGLAAEAAAAAPAAGPPARAGRWSCGSRGEDEPLARAPARPRPRGLLRRRAAQDLPARGVRLRTRALTTTMFARYLLGDLFIHGIGGAKYDELGDEIARGFFGIEPPGVSDALA